MKNVHEFTSEQGKFSLYFLTCGSEKPSDMFDPVIELTHNHGTENMEDFSYHNGNETSGG